MPPSLRREMEQRFGHDFSAVRLHDGPRAADLAESLSAKALTVGPHIAFSRGRFAPDTRDGKHLLSHELAHVVQQSRGGAAQPTLDGSGPLEAAAEQAAGAVTAGGGAVNVSGGSAAGTAAQPEEDAREGARKVAQEQLSQMDKEDQKQAAADKEEEQAADRAHPRVTLSLLPNDPRQLTRRAAGEAGREIEGSRTGEVRGRGKGGRSKTGSRRPTQRCYPPRAPGQIRNGHEAEALSARGRPRPYGQAPYYARHDGPEEFGLQLSDHSLHAPRYARGSSTRLMPTMPPGRPRTRTPRLGRRKIVISMSSKRSSTRIPRPGRPISTLLAAG